MPPYTLRTEVDVRLSGAVLLFTVAATMLAGVLFGCIPAWQAARINLNEVLKERGRSAVSTGRGGLRRTLVIAEFAARSESARRWRPGSSKPLERCTR